VGEADGTRRIFRSLAFIVAMEVLGWGSNSLYIAFGNSILGGLGLTTLNWVVNTLTSYLLYIAASSDAVVLYLCKCVCLNRSIISDYYTRKILIMKYF
jgi:hypothetical protein